MTESDPRPLATGFGAGGERWTLTTAGSGRRRRTMVQIIEPDGRRWGGGFGGDPLSAGMRLATFAGQSGPSSHLVIIRVAADVRAVIATLSDGSREDLSLHGDAAVLGARLAVLVYPRQLDMHRLVLRNAAGRELGDLISMPPRPS